MVSPCAEFAGGIDATFQIVKTDGAIVVMVKIVFACPEKFNGNTDFFRDCSGFHHVIVGKATTEPATAAAKMDGDIGGGDF